MAKEESCKNKTTHIVFSNASVLGFFNPYVRCCAECLNIVLNLYGRDNVTWRENDDGYSQQCGWSQKKCDRVQKEWIESNARKECMKDFNKETE